MLANEQMKAGRYLRWHRARRKVAVIRNHLEAGRVVVVSTYTKATKYDHRHVEMFRASKAGAFVRRGQSWDCIDGCAIRVYQS